ncbi:MAG: NADH-quinone oxidoreductase subunit J [Gammaproteobacteria bacterium]|nr:NADH-quinone oxidoreductase subunit J [Gammaproteobacteria bacterium]MCW8888157.1 NADH-quinone oxidoreductase subunit J [Gammaproteobacteria bacterium]
MSFEQIIFYIFSAILVFAATMMVTVRNPVRAAMFLILAFFTSAALWMMLEAEFLAITLVLVYVGAVMVLFIFVIMMLDIDIAVLREGFAKFLPVGIFVALLMLGMILMVVGGEHFGLEIFAAPERHAADYSNTRELGLELYTTYLYAFELAAVILLVAIVAAIALTLRHNPTTKFQQVPEQVAVRRNDRLRVVEMDAEERR